ncbi:MAG TPA: PaaI family thioesterase [Vicinamibacterales bacterium]|nr:PaaI family thioesterase [Vicinamibacterales bacterium]
MPTRIETMRRTVAGELPPPPIATLIGFRMTAIEPGRSRFEIDADERHHNPMGTLHGGVLCEIADVAMGSAYASTLDEGESFATLELKINFLRPVRSAHLVADGSVVQRGRTIGLVECDISDEQGRLIAKASSTCMTLRGEQAHGR